MRSFFGDCDRKGGKSHEEIVNASPMWTKRKVVDDMEDALDDLSRSDSIGYTDERVRANKMVRRKKLETTLRQVRASNPVGKIKGKDLDIVEKGVGSWEQKIKDISPTRYDEERAMKGESSINPTLQSSYSKNPCIKLESENEIMLAKSCHMKIDARGMVSRDDMTRGLRLLEQVLEIVPDHLRLQYDRPAHIVRSSQVMVGDIPSDMTKSNIRQAV